MVSNFSLKVLPSKRFVARTLYLDRERGFLAGSISNRGVDYLVYACTLPLSKHDTGFPRREQTSCAIGDDDALESLCEELA